MGRLFFHQLIFSQNGTLGIIVAIAFAGDLALWWKLQQKGQKVDELKGVVDSLTTSLQEKNLELASFKGVSVQEMEGSVPRGGTAGKRPDASASITFGGVLFSAGIPPHASMARFIPLSEHDRARFASELLAELRETGIGFQPGNPTLTGTVYFIWDGKKEKHLIGMVSSLPLVGNHYVAAFEQKNVSSISAACALTARDLAAGFYAQQNVQRQGILRSVTLGSVIMETGEEGDDILQAAAQEILLTNGARYGRGPALIGYGTMSASGRTLSLSVIGREGHRVSSALPITLACTDIIPCGRRIDEAIKAKIVEGITAEHQ